MPIDTYEDLSEASDEELVEFLREQIIVILEAGEMNRKIIIACFNTILAEITKRLDLMSSTRKLIDELGGW